MAKKKVKQVTLKQITHIVMIVALFIGSMLAWNQSFREAGCGAEMQWISITFLGIPFCVMSAMIFSAALVLAAALWFME